MSTEALSSYQRKLFFFLSIATFFEGYDFLAITQILPNLRADMGLDEAEGGYLVSLINLGTVIAYLLVRKADRWGRRRVLGVTIVGYTVFTFLSGLSPNVWVFGLTQMVARVFLIGEWAIANVVAAEEFPAKRRGTIIGVVLASGSLGSIVCAGVVPMLLKTSYGWRSVYFVGILPLIVLMLLRRGLRETRRFEEQVKAPEPKPLLHIWSTPYRRRVLQLGAIWFCTYVCTHNGVTFWKEFAKAERGMTDGQVGLTITIAAVVAMPLVFFAGKLIDVLGRRGGAVVIYALGGFGIVGAYTFSAQVPLTVSLVFAIFGASAVLSVLNAYNTELFPTELRGDAFAWSNNLLGRIGYVLSPLALGVAAREVGWGPAVRTTSVFVAIALVLILWLMPETRNKELEQTSAL